MRALALEHWRSDAFSVFGELLAERQVSVDRVLVSDVDHLPDWQEYDLIIAMGGPMGVYEEGEYPWLVGEKRTIREAVTAGTPFFGVCFGAQLLASSLGAEVYRGPAPELGLSPIFLMEAARRDPVFRGFPRDLEVFEWHQDAFDLPARRPLPRAVAPICEPGDARRARRVRHPVPLREVSRGCRKVIGGKARAPG